ncbi:MAG: bifunctional phosphoserine phosphatase/homoserine phosphotransferase ThrH [Desulfobacteraceae bacterium]|nr:MAG: bifunctional phosphoserine phosphatase/homoserine phosphotransferase ThrH [Desulfobacteraceae bacterium]
MNIVCSDLEGVFVPEIWINVAKKTGIEELKLTTRDISDYNVLMKRRLKILEENKLTIHDITNVIATMDPLAGAVDFLDWLRSQTQVIIVSDTFEQFAGPLMKKLKMPTLFCHTLSINGNGMVTGYNLRQPEAKKQTVIAMKSLKYRVIAFGDSYNDIGMLKEADAAMLFRPPENVIREFPEFPVTTDYPSLQKLLAKELAV